MQLTLKPEVEALIQQELNTGRFQDINDLIETALYALADSRHYTLAEMEEMIEEGLDEVDHSDLYSEDEARAYIAARRAELSPDADSCPPSIPSEPTTSDRHMPKPG